MTTREISISEMTAARERTKTFLHKTPVMSSEKIDQILASDIHVLFKCEHLQKTGSFKTRGALNSVKLAAQDGVSGVITHSSGNHGQALAWSAKKCGLPCVVVVPKNAPATKVQAIEGYKAEIIKCEPTTLSRNTVCKENAEKLGYRICPPFNSIDMINGHASMIFEISEDHGDVIDSVFVAVGGGGLGCSVAFATADLMPHVKVYLIEPAGKKLKNYLDIGEVPERDVIDTIADGVRTSVIGDLCTPSIKQYCRDTIISVTNDEIREAMKLIWLYLKQRVEPTAAMPLAALMFHRPENVKKPMTILCGGNVDLDFIP